MEHIIIYKCLVIVIIYEYLMIIIIYMNDYKIDIICTYY